MSEGFLFGARQLFRHSLEDALDINPVFAPDLRNRKRRLLTVADDLRRQSSILRDLGMP
jgi:hypothetical protein